MKKQILAMIALLLCIAMIFVGCGKPAEPYVPEFTDDKEIIIGAWSGSMTKYDTQQFSNLEMADINLLVASSENFIQYNTTFFDMAEAAGVRVLPDSRKWNGQAPSYLEHPAFAGYCVWDEPASTAFEDIAEKKALWDSTMGDSLFFINVLPGYSGTSLGGSFKTYISTYMDTVEPEVLCFDHYPLLDDGNGVAMLRDTFFSDMDICSHYAKEHGAEFWFTLLSAGHAIYVTPNAAEMRWQMAVAQAYGATGLLHYVYGTHDGDYTAPIDWSTQSTTEVYEAMKLANNEIAAWDHIYLNYDWQGTATVSSSDSAAPSVLFQLCEFSIDPTENTGITAIESSEDLLCGVFKDDGGNMAYMLTNATNPADYTDATVTLTLDEKYVAVLVIDSYEQNVITLEKGMAEITVDSSRGVFVIPLTGK